MLLKQGYFLSRARYFTGSVENIGYVIGLVGPLAALAVALVIIARSRSGAGEGSPSCVQCGYELRGLVAPRCPECGRVYTLDEFYRL